MALRYGPLPERQTVFVLSAEDQEKLLESIARAYSEQMRAEIRKSVIPIPPVGGIPGRTPLRWRSGMVEVVLR